MIEKKITAYTEYLRNRGYSVSTIQKYGKEAGVIWEYMNHERKVCQLQDIKKEDIKAYQSGVYIKKRKRDGKALSASTIAGKIIALKSFFKYLLKTGEIMYNPASEIEVPIIRKDKVREVLKEKEIKRMIEGAGLEKGLGIRDRAILEVLYSTGMRNTELRELRLKDIDLERQEVHIRKGKGYFGSRERVLPLGRLAAAYLYEYLKEVRPGLVAGKQTEHLFISCRGRKLTIGVPNYLVKKYAKKAGIKKKVHTHMIRHTCATHFLRGGADIRYVQELLGHSSLDSTKIYTKVEIGDLKKAHKKSHPRERV